MHAVNWFHEKFLQVRVNFRFFHTVTYLGCTYLPTVNNTYYRYYELLYCHQGASNQFSLSFNHQYVRTVKCWNKFEPTIWGLKFYQIAKREKSICLHTFTYSISHKKLFNQFSDFAFSAFSICYYQSKFSCVVSVDIVAQCSPNVNYQPKQFWK